MTRKIARTCIPHLIDLEAFEELWWKHGLRYLEHVLEPFIRFIGLFHLYWKLADHRHIFHAQTSQPFTLLVDELGHSRFAGGTIIHSSLHNVSRPLHHKILYCCVWLYRHVFWARIDLHRHLNLSGKNACHKLAATSPVAK